MAIVITLQKATDAPVDVTQYADLRSMVIGGKAANGERSVSSIKFYEDINDLVTVTATYIVKVVETDTTPDTTLASGRVIGWQTRRSEGHRADGDHLQEVTFEDANIELMGLAFAPNEGGADADGNYARPEETDVERVLALIADFANGDPRASTVITTTKVRNANTVTMLAETYPAGSTPWDVINDCASQAGKMAFIDADYDLFYDIRNATEYTAGASISDRIADVDNVTTFPPEWIQGDALDFNGQNIASGIVLTWAPERSVFIEDAAAEAQFDYWVSAINVECDSQQQANQKAQKYIDTRQRGERSYFPSLLFNSDQVDLVKYGQRISIKSRITDVPVVAQSRRIAELKWEYLGYGKYYAHLTLDYPTRLVPLDPGQAPNPRPADPPTTTITPGAFGSAGAGGQTTGSPLQLVCPATVNAGDLLVAHVIRESHATIGTPVGWTLHAQADQTPDLRGYLFYKVADGTEDGASISFTASNLGVAKYGRIYRFTGGVTGASLGVVTTTDGASVATANAPAVSGTVGNLGCLFVAVGQNQMLGDMTGESGVNWVEAITETNMTVGDVQLQTGTLTAATTSGGSMALAAGSDYLIMGLTIGEATLSGGNSPPDLVGDDPEYARSDHTHVQFSHRPPTVNDDVGDLYEEGTWWVQVDDVDNPTNIEAIWLLLDNTAGAAVWDKLDASTISGGALTPLPWVNVLDHGADPTGIADSWAAFDAALETRAERSAAVIVPPGVYRMSGPLVLGNSTVILGIGANMEEQDPGGGGALLTYQPHSVLYFDNDTDGIVAPDDAAVTYRCHHPVLENLTIRGGGAGQGNRGVWFRDNASSAVSIQRVGLGEIRNCFFEYWTTAIDFDGTADSCKVIGGHIHECDKGFVGGVSEDVFERVCVWSLDTGPAVSISGDRGQVIGCEIEPLVGSGIVLTSTASFNRIVANDVKDVTGTAINVAGDDNTIVGNTASRSVSTYYADTGTDNVWAANTPSDQFPASGGASALDDLTDVTISAPAADDQLQYIGGVWVNNSRRWEPVVTDPGTGPELVFDGTGDIVMTWVSY